VAEEVEAVEGAEEVVAKAENKRRLGQKGENTKLEVKKSNHRRIRINSKILKSESDMQAQRNIFKSNDENSM